MSILNPVIYVPVCLILRIVAVICTIYSVDYKKKALEGNPIMAWLFKRFGIIKVFSISMIVMTAIVICMALRDSILGKIILLLILLADAGNDIIVCFRTRKT